MKYNGKTTNSEFSGEVSRIVLNFRKWHNVYGKSKIHSFVCLDLTLENKKKTRIVSN